MIALGLAIGATGFKASIGDQAFYLAAGRYMAEHGGVAGTDVWTHTVDGEPFVNATWGAQRVYYALFRIGGYPLVRCVPMAAALFAILLIAFCAARLARRAAVVPLAAATASILIAQNLSVRPETLAIPLAAAYGCLALTARPRAWTVLVSAGIVVVWTQIHGSFGVAMALSATIAAGHVVAAAAQETGSLRARFHAGLRAAWLWDGALGHAVTAAAALAATFLNPWGWRIWEFVVVGTSSSMGREMAEWSPIGLNAAGARLLLAGVIAFVATRGATPRLAWRDVVPVVAFTILGIYSMRFLCWLMMSLPLAIARAAVPREREVQRRIPNWAAASIVAVPLAILVLMLPQVRVRGLTPHEQAAELFEAHHLPAELSAWAREERITGNLFHPVRWGSWLAWDLYPQGARTFVDLRMWVFDDQTWQEYRQIESAADGWEAALDARDVRTLLLSSRDQMALIDAADASPRWQRAAAADQGAAFLRVDESAPEGGDGRRED